MQDFRKLNVWVKAHKLVIIIYRITNNFPDIEKFGITSQIRRAGVSIPTNIAEGAGRKGDIEFSRFLHIAFSSANEVEYLSLLSYDLGYLDNEKYQEVQNKVVEVKKMIMALLKKLQADS